MRPQPRRMTGGGSCYICRRRNGGLAFKHEGRLYWSCKKHDDREYDDLMWSFRKMAKAEFSACEQQAFIAAGDAAGAYADRIGKTDLALMSPVEWWNFRKIMLDTFGATIEAILRTGLKE